MITLRLSSKQFQLFPKMRIFSERPKNKDINQSMNNATSKHSELAHNQDLKKKKGWHILLSFSSMHKKPCMFHALELRTNIISGTILMQP